MSNWIVWKRTVFEIEIEPLYLCYTELFEMEPLICIKMDLALITYNDWCANKTKQN